MNEYLEEAREELKRVDHMIFVSLKYTRTVDVIRNALNRLISAFDYIIEGILWYCKEQKKIKSIPKSPKAKITMLNQIYPEDEKLDKYTMFYIFLRELFKAPYGKREEYRRHVTMIAKLENRTAEVNIDNLEDCFDKIAREFLDHAKFLVGEVEEDD